MKTLTLALLVFFNIAAFTDNANEENTRFVLIEAKCTPGFNALPEYTEKVILTKVFKKEFANAFEIVNAEPDLISEFEVALEKAYPNSRNQVRDILVYMLTTEQEAKELYQRKINQFKTLNTGVIELKLR